MPVTTQLTLPESAEASLAGRRPTFRTGSACAHDHSGDTDPWLADWTRLARLVQESYQRLYVATTVDTDDHASERRYYTFLEELFPASQAAEQPLKQQLLASGLEPENFAVPLEQMRTQARLFRHANLPLLSDEQKLPNADDKIRGAQTVEWEVVELTLDQLQPLYQMLIGRAARLASGAIAAAGGRRTPGPRSWHRRPPHARRARRPARAARAGWAGSAARRTHRTRPCRSAAPSETPQSPMLGR